MRLIALAGLPGGGKSTIAREVARRTGAVWLRGDFMDQAIWSSGTAPARDIHAWDRQRLTVDTAGRGVAECVDLVLAAP